MKKNARAVSLFGLVLLMSGCASVDKQMKSYLGQHNSVLAAQWGPPNDRMPDGQGGEVWIYSQVKSWTTPATMNTSVNSTRSSYGNLYGQSTSQYYASGNNLYGRSSLSGNYNTSGSTYATATTTYTPAQTHGYTAHRSFFVNSDGIIYRYAWKGW